VVTVGHKERGHGGGHGSHGGSMRRWRGVELRWRRRKVMIGGAHLSARHREGRRRCEGRHFPMREVAIRQGTTDARSTGLRGRVRPGERPRPNGEGGGERLVGKEEKRVVAGLKGRMGQK
jgi:hypothetical protein